MLDCVPRAATWCPRAIVMVGALAVAGSAAADGRLDFVRLDGGRLPPGLRLDTGPAGRLHGLDVAPFRLMRHEVTNRQFAAFVAATGHLTDSERKGFGYVWTGRWRRVAGADWRHPFGPESTIAARGAHPVVQVSQQDAAAFCRFHGARLPDSREWALAAAGPDGRLFPWGDAPPEQPSRRANFGTVACCAPDAADGYQRTAPVGSFPKGRTPEGLHDMAGNVWEWTSSRVPGRPDRVVLRGGGWGNNPHCLRASYHHGNPPDIGLDMVGFRCAADPEAP